MSAHLRNVRALKLTQDELRSRTGSDDVRAARTSASSMERIYLCPGSLALERQIKELPKVDSVRDAGSRIHAALAGEIESAVLDEDERWMFEQCESWRNEALRMAFPETDLLELRQFREERIYMEVEGEIVNSGEFDALYLDGNGRLLILDYKTGYIPVADTSENYQLRNYAVLVWLLMRDTHVVREVKVAVIQPRCRPIVPPICTYQPEHLQLALSEMLLLIQDAKDPNAKRFPSLKACTYCKALAHCHEAALEARGSMENLRHVTLRLPSIEQHWLSPEELARREAICDGKELAKSFKAMQFLDKYKEAVTSEIRVRLESLGTVEGCELKSGVVRRSVRDMWEFRERVGEIVSPREILSLLAPSMSKVRDLLAGKFPHLKKKDLQQTVDEYLAGILNEDQNRPSVVLTKE